MLNFYTRSADPTEAAARDAAHNAVNTLDHTAALAKRRAQRLNLDVKKLIKGGNLNKARQAAQRAKTAADEAATAYAAAVTVARETYISKGGKEDPDQVTALTTTFIKDSKTRAETAAYNAGVYILNAEDAARPTGPAPTTAQVLTNRVNMARQHSADAAQSAADANRMAKHFEALAKEYRGFADQAADAARYAEQHANQCDHYAGRAMEVDDPNQHNEFAMNCMRAMTAAHLAADHARFACKLPK